MRKDKTLSTAASKDFLAELPAIMYGHVLSSIHTEINRHLHDKKRGLVIVARNKGAYIDRASITTTVQIIRMIVREIAEKKSERLIRSHANVRFCNRMSE